MLMDVIGRMLATVGIEVARTPYIPGKSRILPAPGAASRFSSLISPKGFVVMLTLVLLSPFILFEIIAGGAAALVAGSLKFIGFWPSPELSAKLLSRGGLMTIFIIALLLPFVYWGVATLYLKLQTP